MNYVIVPWYIRDVYDDKGNFARDENGAPIQERVEEKVKIKDLALTRRIQVFVLSEIKPYKVMSKQRPKLSKLRIEYGFAKSAKVGDEVCCPSCKTKFVKSSYQQVFCKTKGGTKCKDYYWNNVTPEKRNNTTRISPANAAYRALFPEKFARRTSEGYVVIDGTAYDEWGEAVYSVDWADDDRQIIEGETVGDAPSEHEARPSTEAPGPSPSS